MPFAVEFSGPRDPLPATPPRMPGSIRRTTTIDVVRTGDLYGPARIDARGRDLRTDRDGRPEVVAAARLGAGVDPEKVLTALSVVTDGVEVTGPPGDAALARLVGAATTAGFRAVVADALADHLAAGTLWHLLVDDLVGAVLVSGVAPQHAEELAGGGPIEELTRSHAELMFATMSDICAGWAPDAVMLSEFARTHKLPVACGPDAPPSERDDDPWSWHDTAPLPPHGVRRRRRIDLGPLDADGRRSVDVHFRDSHVDAAGRERCVHEYTVDGWFDPDRGVLGGVRSTARVLPWRECPAAVGSAARVEGVPVSELRRHVRAELRGPTTCTHLNDTLRSLADVGALARIAAE